MGVLSIVFKPTQKTVLEVQGFCYGYGESDGENHRPNHSRHTDPARRRWILDRVDLTIAAGECHCICGATGSGKSTLALALKGLLPEGCQCGEIRVSNDDVHGDIHGDGATRSTVGLVLQNPETQLFAHNVGAEVAFGLENLGIDPQQMASRVKAALVAVDLNCPLTMAVRHLSMGQKYRLLMAAMLVMDPQILVLDEPVAQLDPQGRRELVNVLRCLRQQGVAIVLCEHRPQSFAALIDHYWLLVNGCLLPGGAALVNPTPPRCKAASPVLPPSPSSVVVEAEALAVGYDPQQPLWQQGDFTLSAGQQLLISGDNGCGKSSLMRTLCGFLSPLQGQLRVFGERPQPHRLRGKIGCLLQNPHKQLTETTVVEELMLSHRLAGRCRKQRRSQSLELLQQCGIEALAPHSPHQLSYGQRHLVALAAVLIAQPQLLLLDDPFAGLDQPRQQRLRELIDERCQQGLAVICTCHDLSNDALCFDQRWQISGGRFEAQNG